MILNNETARNCQKRFKNEHQKTLNEESSRKLQVTKHSQENHKTRNILKKITGHKTFSRKSQITKHSQENHRTRKTKSLHNNCQRKTSFNYLIVSETIVTKTNVLN